MTPSQFITLRHQLHRHAQISGQEQYAHDVIVDYFSSLHSTRYWTYVGTSECGRAYGAAAVWESDPKAPTIVFRADNDALPINETLSLDYASCSAGMAHKCGHDGHTTILLLLADLVDDAFQQGKLACNVLLLWQPEEETGLGSRKMIDANILQQYDVRAVYGFHNIPGYSRNEVIIVKDTFAAASVGLEIWLHGRQTHASTPEKGVNPGEAVALLIRHFASFGNTDAAPRLFRQSTLICVRLGSEVFGTSAGDAYVAFTLRAFSNDAMKHLLGQAQQAARDIAQQQGLQVRMSLREPFYATENHHAQVETLERLCQTIGRHYTFRPQPFRWSEDFANYLMQWPGAMFGIGSGEDHCELHHPDYDFPDDVIAPTADLLLSLILYFNETLN